MPEKVIIIGAGGHAKVIADIVIKNGDRLIGFLDDKKINDTVLGYSVLGKIDLSEEYKQTTAFIIGIGDNRTRRKLAESLDLNWYTAIHPSAQVGIDVKIGKGTTIMANAVINTGVRIGNGVIINTAVIVEHDSIIEDFAHISPGAVLCGGVSIGTCTHIGGGAVVRNNVRICEYAVVGCGGVVVRDISEAGTYVGVPTRKS